MKKILLIIQHADYSKALAAYLGISNYKVCEQVYHDGIAVAYNRFKPDLTITSICYAENAIPEIRGTDKDAKVLCMSPFDEFVHLWKAKELNANGYCAQTTCLSKLLIAIDTVIAGNEYWFE